MYLNIQRISRSLSPRKYLKSRSNSEDIESNRKLPLSARCPKGQENNQRNERISRVGSVKLPKTKIDICPSLSNYQVHLLKNSWANLQNKNINKDISGCFQVLERISSAASKSFNSALKTSETDAKLWQPQIIIDHTSAFNKLLGRIISNENGVDEELRRLGAAHVNLSEKYGLGVHEFEKFGEIMADRFLSKDGIRQNNEVTHAWCVLVSTIVDYMKAGFESELRLRRRRYSISFTGEV
uniref:Neuroglobin n=1 Tax=Acrobeloides nanus TaxID=290746 RepID=A0A914DW86_9BILA